MEKSEQLNEIYSKFTIKTEERHQRRRSVVLIIKFQRILHILLKFRLLSLNK